MQTAFLHPLCNVLLLLWLWNGPWHQGTAAAPTSHSWPISISFPLPQPCHVSGAYYILHLLEFPAHLVITGSLQENAVITTLNQTRRLAQITLRLSHPGALWGRRGLAQPSGARMGARASAASCGTGTPAPLRHGVAIRAQKRRFWANWAFGCPQENEQGKRGGEPVHPMKHLS